MKTREGMRYNIKKGICWEKFWHPGVIYEEPMKAATDKKCPLITMQPFSKRIFPIQLFSKNLSLSNSWFYSK